MTRQLTGLLMIIALCFDANVSAQQSATQNQTKATPTQTKPAEQDQLKVNTELVEVHAVVTDKQGQIVRGLKQEPHCDENERERVESRTYRRERA